MQCLLKLTGRPAPPTPRQAVLRKLSDPLTGDTIDHALVLWFPGQGEGAQGVGGWGDGVPQWQITMSHMYVYCVHSPSQFHWRRLCRVPHTRRTLGGPGSADGSRSDTRVLPRTGWGLHQEVCGCVSGVECVFGATMR